MSLSARLLPPEFYLRTDVVQIAKDLLGKILFTEIDGIISSGKIVETEAYRGPDDRACHAWNYRRTPRTEVMFGAGGHAYVYICYGIHHLFNVVTAPADDAHAVLIRAVEPIENVEFMLARRGFSKPIPALTAGPGALSKALGITTDLNGVNLYAPDSPIRILDAGYKVEKIMEGKRIGVESAGESAHWPWRFWEAGNRWVSKGSGRLRDSSAKP